MSSIIAGIFKREKPKEETRHLDTADPRNLPPFRYCEDIKRILRNGNVGDKKLRVGCSRFNDYSVWLKNYPSRGQEMEVLCINESGLFTPSIYRPQGKEKWEDRLIWLSEYKGISWEEMNEQNYRRMDEVWKLNHSPLS
ncbi:hypothetical protein IKF03_00595 [Candidatus Saccharibacteria bacterium]|nr:hypothetical protein [Candidatus Saccharibacteria bacterium]